MYSKNVLFYYLISYMSDKNSNTQENTSSSNTPKRPPETPEPKSLYKLRRDSQDNDD